MTEPGSSLDEVAKHLGVVKDSIYRLIVHRGLPVHKIGRPWKFKLTEVDAWDRSGSVGAHDDESNGGEPDGTDGR
jgi:excisionase family DNA binding protein